jgi:hypothetical protein
VQYVLKLILVISLALSSAGQQQTSPNYVGAGLLGVMKILANAKLSGSLVYSGNCPAGFTPAPPAFQAPGSTGGSPLQQLREMITDNSPLQVKQDEQGLIRFFEPSVPDDLLSVKIKHIAFDGSGTFWRGGVYSPSDAVRIIVRSPEVLAFAKAHHIESTLFSGAMGVPGNLEGQWPANQPRITGSLENVTVQEALDHVLTTFHGVWAYENCPAANDKPRTIWVGFFGLDQSGFGVVE